MAEHILSGVLKDPNGDFSVGDQIRFTHISTTGETILSARSIFTVPPNGEYTIGLQFGLIRIEYWDIISKSWSLSGEVTINQDTIPITLPGLLNTLVPVLPPVILEMEALVADAETAAADASDDADRAEAAADSIVGENYLINGGFDVWQRGVSGLSGAVFTADMWKSEAAQMTVSKGGTIPDTIPTNTYLDMTRSNTGSTLVANPIELETTGENDIFTIGSTWTVSWWTWVEDAASLPSWWADFADDSDNTNRVAIAGANEAAITAQTWTKMEKSFTINTVPAGTSNCLLIRIGAAAVPSTTRVLIAATKLERGAQATIFTRSGNTLPGELPLCQAYLQPVPEDSRITGQATSSTNGAFSYMLPVTMRVTPSLSATTDGDLTNSSGGNEAVTSISFDSGASSDYSVAWSVTVGGTPLTPGHATIHKIGTTFLFSAEL